MTNTLERRSALAISAAAAGLTFSGTAMAASEAVAFEIKPLSIDPKSIPGLSENILRSHYDNNYTGAVKRLNAINEQLAALDFAAAPNFTINGLKREQLVAMNSMIFHEIYFAGLGGKGDPSGNLASA